MFNNYAIVGASTAIAKTTCSTSFSLKIYGQNQALHMRDMAYYTKAAPWTSLLEDARVFPDLNLVSYYPLTETSLRFQDYQTPANF